MLSSVVIVRFREIIKISSNTSKNFADIAKQGVISSLLRILFICIVLVVLGAFISILFGGYLLFAGLQITLASIVACICTIFILPLLWVFFNEKKSLN